MLGLVPDTTLMDALVCPPLCHKLGINGPPFIGRRPFDEILGSSVVDPDPILEDTPGPLDDSNEVDYAVFPPDIGKNVVVNEVGYEVAFSSGPLNNNRTACCVYLSSLSGELDSDEYPFDAVTYGESSNPLGLPYNDHTYVSADQPPNKNSMASRHDDRLALLAKLALAKDSGPVDRCVFRRAQQGLIITSDRSPLACPKQPFSDSSQVDTSYPVVSVGNPVTTHLPDQHTLKTVSHSLVSNTPRISTLGGRTFVLSSTQTSVTSPPLQVHRISSSLTPHIVLRTGIPALHISTTAPRLATSELNGPVRCACGLNHTEGTLIQCEKCRTYHHADCVSTRVEGRTTAMPYLCEQCRPRHSQGPHQVTIQRHQLSSLPASVNSGIRISRSAALGATNASTGRIFVTTPVLSNTSAHPLHLCVPNSSTHSEFAVLPSTSEVGPGCPRNYTLVTHSNSAPHIQPLRSSKRKQDLMTLAGASPNAGLECVPHSPSLTETTSDQIAMSTPYTSDSRNSLCMESSHSNSVANQQPAVFTMTSSVPDQSTNQISNSLHRLLVHDIRDQSNTYNSFEVREVSRHASPLSSSSDSILSPISSDAYEETSDLRFSERFYQKLDGLFPSSCPTAFVDLPGYFKEEFTQDLSNVKRCQVVSFDFNRKGLIASEDLYPRESIIEYRGLCMLLSEYNEIYDYRKHYNPFVLFYKSWSKLPLCVDARRFGNEARFIRRSCTPNCEVRHSLSVFHDPLSGPTIRIRLMISASRHIMRSTELTLPFDFDYTTCRYLVKCACTRKTCPVVRWFRQTNQLDNTDANRVSSNSLLYSRKLPVNTRGSGSFSRPCGFSATLQDNYSDILTDECSQADPCSWSDNLLDSDDLHFMGRFRPHRTFRSASRTARSTHRSDDSTKITRARGRSGRDRRFEPMKHELHHKNGLFRGAKIKQIGRGRPRKLKSHLSSITQREGAYFAKTSPHPHLRTSNVSQTEDSSDDRNSKQTRDRRVSWSSDISVNDGTSSPLQSPCFSRLRSPTERVSRNRRQPASVKIDELDVDSEPKCTTEDLRHLAASPGFTSPPFVTVHSDSVEGADSERVTVQQHTTVKAKSQSGHDIPKALKSRRSLAAMNRYRDKRPRNSVHGTKDSSARKSVHACEEDKEKTREEVWMAQVLRRIERMERKRHLYRQRQSAPDPAPFLSELLVEKKDPPTISHSSINAENEGADAVTTDELTAPHVEKMSCNSTELLSVNPEDLSQENLMESMEHDFNGGSTVSCEGSLLFTTSPPIQATHRSSSSSRVSSELCSVTDSSGSIEHSYATLKNSTPKRTSAPSFTTRIVTKSHASAQRRRRSQTALLSDGLSRASGDQCRDSREERWLKSQLRRIAELEFQTSTPPTTVLPKETCEFTAPARPHNVCDSQEPAITALKEVSCNGDTIVNLATTTSVSLLNFDPPVQTGSGHRRRLSAQSSTDADSVIGTEDVISHLQPYNTDDDNTGRKHSLSNRVNAEADCELIVYRTRDADPMAKFSRGRLMDANTVISTSAVTTTAQENTPPSTTESTREAISFPSIGTASFNNTTSHTTPRPTKKRWLSQALMEDDGEHFSTGSTACVAVSDRLGPPVVSSCEHTHGQTVFAISSCCTVPVNPKKRIISQFSGMIEDVSITNTTNMAPCVNNEQSESGLSLLNGHAATSVPYSAVCNRVGTYDTVETTIHSTSQLPPKKATVKQQTEEMRKVRVSLSEYRRRRGLSSITLPASTKSARGVTETTDPTGDLGSLPRLMSPNRLLDEIPKLYQQLRIPERMSHHSVGSCNPSAPSSGHPVFPNDMVGRDSSHSLFDDLMTNRVVLTHEDRSEEERGPRTPSESLDDEDGDSGDDAVYVRRPCTVTSDITVENLQEKMSQTHSVSIHPPVLDPHSLKIPHNRVLTSKEENECVSALYPPKSALLTNADPLTTDWNMLTTSYPRHLPLSLPSVDLSLDH